jgi:hypothetical protein
MTASAAGVGRGGLLAGAALSRAGQAAFSTVALNLVSLDPVVPAKLLSDQTVFSDRFEDSPTRDLKQFSRRLRRNRVSHKVQRSEHQSPATSLPQWTSWRAEW